MQFSTITTLFTLAAVAVAAPAEVAARTGGTGSCSNSQPNEYCCSGLNLLGCTLNILGNSCGGTAYCCDSSVTGSVVDISLLNCVSL
ncbi:uncharacterized protein GGS22DRAFT_163644 [Annulohypoxylon maeteangense]|uniref:uncharacterized protein n=1 Tax=Annulohypoxylon maeteangense TaxID=1927788 RepID=UPI00200778CB|nr:uncharacterized protein GGS22DRAFT_163644 [Annulohypoxylon maeteangense]KAI0885408.1 hypothetical protein GGS22DRAFT_163644 [Annulohypoxylon maeteangense]